MEQKEEIESPEKESESKGDSDEDHELKKEQMGQKDYGYRE